jgi:hypothetical protein
MLNYLKMDSIKELCKEVTFLYVKRNGKVQNAVEHDHCRKA